MFGEIVGGQPDERGELLCEEADEESRDAGPEGEVFVCLETVDCRPVVRFGQCNARVGAAVILSAASGKSFWVFAQLMNGASRFLCCG